MPSYLLTNKEYKIDDQRYVYGMRNKMADIPSSFTAKEKTQSKRQCDQTEDIEHIYNCKYLNRAFQKHLFRKRFLLDADMKKGEKVKNEATHVIHSDPLYSIVSAV